MPLLPDSARGVGADNVQIIHVEAKREMRKRIVRELQIMHSCHSDYIVTFYGAFLNDNNDVIMCMEYADVGYAPIICRVDGMRLMRPDLAAPLTEFPECLAPSVSTSSARSPRPRSEV